MRPPCNEGFETLSCSVAARGLPNDGQIHAVAVDCLALFGIKKSLFSSNHSWYFCLFSVSFDQRQAEK